jgi:hypothetical protein
MIKFMTMVGCTLTWPWPPVLLDVTLIELLPLNSLLFLTEVLPVGVIAEFAPLARPTAFVQLIGESIEATFRAGLGAEVLPLPGQTVIACAAFADVIPVGICDSDKVCARPPPTCPRVCASLTGEKRPVDEVVAVAAFDIVIVVPEIAKMVVPNGTLGCEMYIPTHRPVADPTVAVELLLVRLRFVET